MHTTGAPTRRQVLCCGIGLTALVSSGVVSLTTGCSTEDRYHSPAYAAWDHWAREHDQGVPISLVAAGVLAANPHDTQPWLFKLSEERVEVWADTGRSLGAMDPWLREMHLGLGCAIENMSLAAAANNYATTMEAVQGSLAPGGERDARMRAASLKLTKIAGPLSVPEIYHAIPHRHTNRYPFMRNQALPAAWHQAVEELSSAENGIRVFLFVDGPQRGAFDATVIEATRAIIEDDVMIADSDRWFRNSTAEVERFRSGVTLDAAGLSPLTLAMARILPPLPARATHNAWLALTRDRQIATAPVMGLIAVHDRYDRPATLAAGRAWQRLHLAATTCGVAMQPLNQPIEMVDRERQRGSVPTWERRLSQLTGTDGWQATFAFRAGIPTRHAPRSPRRALSEVLVT